MVARAQEVLQAQQEHKPLAAWPPVTHASHLPTFSGWLQCLQSLPLGTAEQEGAATGVSLEAGSAVLRLLQQVAEAKLDEVGIGET